jgi:hypothetical protein
MTDALAHFTAEQKYKEALREVAMRKRLYPKWVQKGQMTEMDAAAKIAIMQAIATDYEKLVEPWLL